MARTRLLFLPVTLAAAVALSACGGSGSSDSAPASTGAAGASTTAASASPIKVVATTTQLGDFVREIGGAGADVTQVLQPNTDPHDYEPRPNDVTSTSGAKIVFESGNNLDRWMGKVVEQSGGSPTVVTLADSNVDRLAGEASGPEASRYDPHWWHDPANVEAAIPVIAQALATANPGDRATYEANADAYLRQVQAMDAGVKRCFAQVPESERKLVTDHDAFNYFAKHFGIHVIGAVIPSQTTTAQASAGELARLAQTIKSEGVRAIFPETSVNSKLEKSIASETGASADYTLYGDTLGPQGSTGETYTKMEVANADQMVRGFTDGRDGCTVSGI
ncbi:MAG TPA: metal ABC transporter substrate-binding protein [Conexibacter sp.]|jgi:ABC-type Zn uptake system ZnuABC Zn-binding protein ZnuA